MLASGSTIPKKFTTYLTLVAKTLPSHQRVLVIISFILEKRM